MKILWKRTVIFFEQARKLILFKTEVQTQRINYKKKKHKRFLTRWKVKYFPKKFYKK